MGETKRNWSDMAPSRKRAWNKAVREGKIRIVGEMYQIRCVWCSERDGKTVWHKVTAENQQDRGADATRTMEERALDMLQRVSVNGCTSKKRERK